MMMSGVESRASISREVSYINSNRSALEPCLSLNFSQNYLDGTEVLGK
jgi:hypothetical protein